MAYTPSLSLTFFWHQSQVILCHLQLCLSSAFNLYYLKIVFFSDQPFPASCIVFWQFLFLLFLKNIDYVYLLEPPQWGSSNEYPQSMFWAEIWKISEFLSENFQFSGGEIFNIFE